MTQIVSISFQSFTTAAPSSSPQDIELNRVTPTSLTYQWSQVPCGQRGGPNSYQYQLSDGAGNEVVLDNTADLYITIDGLISCTRYYFKVSAANIAGVGPASESVEGVTEIGGKVW